MADPTVARTDRFRRVAAGLAIGTAILAAGPAGAGPDDVAVNLERIGFSDLGRPGIYGDVTVVGTTAVVSTDGPPAAGSPCPTSAAQVVDVKDPRKPAVVASIALPPGTTVALDSLTLDGPAFTGDLLAIAIAPRPGCGTGGRQAYYDLTDAAHPRLLSETAGAAASVSLAQRRDGQVLAVRADASGVDLSDVSDPARPKALARWSDPLGLDRGCAGAARLQDDGEEVVVARGDGRVYELDPTDPTRPAGDPALGPAGEPRAVHATMLPLGNRTIAVVSEESCTGDGTGGRLRVLAMQKGVAPIEEEPVTYPGAGAPGRLVGSGSLAYVAWHGAGLRVVDFGEVRPKTVAQFAPDGADVVGVALLPEHIVVTDAGLGLYVLGRPDEGGGRAGFWSQFLSLLPYFGFPLVAAAMAFLPRWAARRSPAPRGVPAGSPARRRA